MPVISMTPPNRRNGKQSRLSSEDVASLAEGIRAGRFVGDNETTPKRSAAYQRAAAAADLVTSEHGIPSTGIIRRIWPTDPDHTGKDDPQARWLWALGPPAPKAA